MIKSIFLPVMGGVTSESGMAAACELARMHDAHVVAVICTSPVTPMAVEWSTYPLAVDPTPVNAAEVTGSQLYRDLGDRLSAAGVSHERHVGETIWMTPSEFAAMHARYCDITVFGRVAGADVVLEREFFADLLLQSGGPVLMVPADAKPSSSDRAVIAWKPTREAARAVHDALPLLDGKSVQAVVVDARVGDLQHGQLPGAGIAGYLARHGLRVEVVQCQSEGATTGARLLRHAREQGAALLVAGGYGHRRLRERVFGGVTQTLFDDADLPVLFSH